MSLNGRGGERCPKKEGVLASTSSSATAWASSPNHAACCSGPWFDVISLQLHRRLHHHHDKQWRKGRSVISLQLPCERVAADDDAGAHKDHDQHHHHHRHRHHHDQHQHHHHHHHHGHEHDQNQHHQHDNDHRRGSLDAGSSNQPSSAGRPAAPQKAVNGHCQPKGTIAAGAQGKVFGSERERFRQRERKESRQRFQRFFGSAGARKGKARRFGTPRLWPLCCAHGCAQGCAGSPGPAAYSSAWGKAKSTTPEAVRAMRTGDSRGLFAWWIGAAGAGVGVWGKPRASWPG